MTRKRKRKRSIKPNFSKPDIIKIDDGARLNIESAIRGEETGSGFFRRHPLFTKVFWIIIILAVAAAAVIIFTASR